MRYRRRSLRFCFFRRRHRPASFDAASVMPNTVGLPVMDLRERRGTSFAGYAAIGQVCLPFDLVRASAYKERLPGIGFGIACRALMADGSGAVIAAVVLAAAALQHGDADVHRLP